MINYDKNITGIYKEVLIMVVKFIIISLLIAYSISSMLTIYCLYNGYKNNKQTLKVIKKINGQLIGRK